METRLVHWALLTIIAFILLLAILLAPILLIRFRKWCVAAFNLAITNRITSRFAASIAGLRNSETRRSKVWQGLLWTPVRVLRRDALVGGSLSLR